MKGNVHRADPKQQNSNFLVNRLEVDLFRLRSPPGGYLDHRAM